MAMLREIVEGLNGPPFNKGLSLVSDTAAPPPFAPPLSPQSRSRHVQPHPPPQLPRAASRRAPSAGCADGRAAAAAVQSYEDGSGGRPAAAQAAAAPAAALCAQFCVFPLLHSPPRTRDRQLRGRVLLSAVVVFRVHAAV